MTDAQRYPCPYCDKDFARASGVKLHVGRAHADMAPEAPVAPPAAPEAAEAPVVPDAIEAPPQADTGAQEAIPAKPGLMARIRSRRGRGGGHGHSAPVPGERAPKPRGRPRGRRVPLDADISDVWGFAGRRLEATPHYPTGRMLQYQGPAAGVILDRAVAGTLPDRVVLQPLARNRDRYEDVGFLLAGPILTFSITTTMQQMKDAADNGDEELFQQHANKLGAQQEMFGWVLSMMLPRLAAGAKQAAERKAKRDAAIAEAFPELGDDDPVDKLVTMLFTPPPRFAEEASQNGRQPNDRSSAAADQPAGDGVPFGGGAEPGAGPPA